MKWIVIILLVFLAPHLIFAQNQSRDTNAYKPGYIPYITKSDTVWIPADSFDGVYNVVEDPWISVGTSSNGTKKWFIYNSYVTKNYEGIKIWIKAIDPSYTYNKKTYKNIEVKSLVIFDCKNKTFREITSVFYSSTGAFIRKSNTEYSTFRDVVINSIMEIVLKKVCELHSK